jgi:hypothetical protein
MKGVAAGYRQNSFQKEGRVEVLNATKSLASYRIAKLFNMQNLIVNTRWAKVTTEHGETFGVICDEAAGKRALDCWVKITPSLQRELSDLNVLDAICYQRDHGPNNYNIWFDENDAHICAFDNDNPTTFLVTHKLPQNASGNVSPIIRRGLFNRPHVSRSALNVKIVVSKIYFFVAV